MLSLFADSLLPKQSMNSIIQLKQIKAEEKKVVKKLSKKKKAIAKPQMKKIAQPQKSSRGKVNSGKKTIIAKYLTSVREKMANFKYKNRLAKRLKLKGEVKLKFDLVWPNEIKNVEVVLPSKYKALTKSAIESLSRVDELPSFPSEIKEKEIPSIIYTMVYE